MHATLLEAPSAVEYFPFPQSVQLVAAPITCWDQLPRGHCVHCRAFHRVRPRQKYKKSKNCRKNAPKLPLARRIPLDCMACMPVRRRIPRKNLHHRVYKHSSRQIQRISQPHMTHIPCCSCQKRRIRRHSQCKRSHFQSKTSLLDTVCTK